MLPDLFADRQVMWLPAVASIVFPGLGLGAFPVQDFDQYFCFAVGSGCTELGTKGMSRYPRLLWVAASAIET